MTANIVGLQKLMIKEISPHIYNALIVGIIIGKQKAKVFSQNGKESKAVITFTIRDTILDYINITCWGTPESIMLVSNLFSLGDIMEVMKPKIDVRRVNDYGEQFRPIVTSPFTLTVNEPSTQLTKHQGDDQKFKALLSHTTKPMASHVTLANILNSHISEETVDFLVAIRSVGDTRSLMIRNEQTFVREIVVFDNTNPCFKITLWDPVYIEKANNWREKHTILFMTDMKVKYSEFYKSKTGSTTSRTIITENPNGVEAENLRTYALSVDLEPLPLFNNMNIKIPIPESVTNVMSIAQIYNKLETKKTSDLKAPEDFQFACVLYAMITQMDLDNTSYVITNRCTNCRSIVKGERCAKEDCPVAMGCETGVLNSSFDFKINLSDHTGTLNRCRLNGQIAETFLGCQAFEFLKMNEYERHALQWRFLLERFEFKIVIMYVPDKNPSVTIISTNLPPLKDILDKIPHY